MCIGTPMRLLAREGLSARCADAAGRVETVDLSLVPEAADGDHLLVFQGAARRLMDAEEARLVAAALEGVAALMAGTADAAVIDAAFADLAHREPALPPHLAAAFAAGRKEA
ncbi:HypC/HybG/HupF family hydrogenase formation chaperone [Xanthobacter tagetidis]|uniref:HypC/HybG/HupF family hydrogenase formation chaperone n=1 Tax=Xanthobacter tagetidis TaxID=60216 RepID=A0A3L7AG47_9HYPH|nr:HypC/HybG/HupF family hydrogenase formation chaperone [Xanthobacter tagetidis]MBB6306740.1 hydrogenase expression/formation protein HypC [Xanthobacter tagetidis]RLP78955.1 HypC/HybG/HupF family hydrogenase formation chaperone [Xanthobacter tagetidis]